MRRVGAADVWFLTWRAPRGARFIYRLSPDDPLDNPSFGVLRSSSFQADPLNPNRWMCGGARGSAAAIPASNSLAPRLSPGSLGIRSLPSGTLKTFQFTSSPARKRIAPSPSIRPRGSIGGEPDYPLLVLFDGDAYRNLIPTPTILDNLIAAHQLPPMVAVFVSNIAGSRGRELLFNRAFVDAVRQSSCRGSGRTTRSRRPGKNLIGGLSAGGAAATYAALLYPQVFGNVIAQSGAFTYSRNSCSTFGDARRRAMRPTDTCRRKWRIAAAVEAELVRAAGYCAAAAPGALLSRRRPLRILTRAESPAFWIGLAIFATCCLRKGYEVHYQMFVGGHDYLSWRGTVADGLIALAGAP